MGIAEPKYRRPLNDEQLAVLKLLFRFRFFTADQLARHSDRKDVVSIRKRLRILEDQRFIAKRYDKSYKLKGRPAEYYLLPKGARTLREIQQLHDRITDQTIKNLYKDKTASESFMAHSLHIFEVHLKLRLLHDDNLDFFTKTQLNLKKYKYFPKPLPDGYISLRGGVKGTGKEHYFFLDIFEDETPFFVLIARIKKYLEYRGGGDWTWEFPTILMVVNSSRRQKQLLRSIRRELRESWEDDVVFGVTTKEALINTEDGKVWLRADEANEDKALRSLASVHKERRPKDYF